MGFGIGVGLSSRDGLLYRDPDAPYNRNCIDARGPCDRTAATGAPAFVIAGLILAGGRSTRMGGGDKTLLPLGGRPILTRVIERLRPQVDVLALNANGDAGRFAAFGLPVLADAFPGQAGPLAGVLTGMDWAAARSIRQIVTVAADTPFFPADLVTGLRAAAHAAVAPIALAASPGADGGFALHPTFGLWSVALRDDLRAALADGVRRVSEWAGRHRCARAVFHDRGEPFFNVNAPADLDRAAELLAAAR